MTSLASHSWNPYRYAGDLLHDVAVVVLMFHLLTKRSVEGLSKRSQLLYLTLFVSRYLDVFDHSQAFYLLAHKGFFVTTSLLACLAFVCWSSTYQYERDTVSYFLIMILAACCCDLPKTGWLEFLWTLSQYLEGFAMVPQYVFTYRTPSDERGPCGIIAFVVLMGSYRSCYAMNWVHKKIHRPYYSDTHSWLGGAVNLAFFIDFLLFQCSGRSCLRRLTLGVDDGIHLVGQELQSKLGACLLAADREPVIPVVEMGQERPIGNVWREEDSDDEERDTLQKDDEERYTLQKEAV